MRLIRMVIIIATCAVFFGGTLTGVMASQTCCGTSLCNCTVIDVNGVPIPDICQGGSGGKQAPKAPCCITAAQPGQCFCQGKVGKFCASNG
jgi:hypothetical protein